MVGVARMQMSSVVIGGGRVAREPCSQWTFPCDPPAHGMRGEPTEDPCLEYTVSNSPVVIESIAPVDTSLS